MKKLFTASDFDEYVEFDTQAEKCADIANQKVEALMEQLEKMRVALNDSGSWLSRMSELKWEDADYAPKFKESFKRQQVILAGLNTYLNNLKGE